MKVSVELSMYPLSEDYIDHIVEYIDRLCAYEELEIRKNAMSTQVFGDYDQVMNILKEENRRAMSKHPGMVIVSKMVNAYLPE